MPAKIISVEPKTDRCLAVTIEGPDFESVNDTEARRLAIQAAVGHGMPGPGVRRANGTRPFHSDGAPHEGPGALPAGTVWRQTFDLEGAL